MKNIIIALVVVLVVLLGFLAFSGDKVEAPKDTDNIKDTDTSTSTTTQTDAIDTASQDSIIITHTNSGYSPREVTIAKGQTVIFVNEGSAPSWPASAQHPTHTVYPGSDIRKCGTSEENTIFDACRGLEKGESWSFTFNETGDWFYHNHIRANEFGKITVE